MSDTATALREATRSCIGRKGLAATTSRDITREARANLASITYHFGSKDELVAQALLEGLREWLDPALAAVSAPGDPAARTVAAIQALVSTFEQHREQAPTYLQTLAHATVEPHLRDGIVRVWDDIRRLLADDMRALQASGELGGWLHADAMAAVLVAVANGLVVQVTLDPDGPPLPALAAQVGSLLLAARDRPD